MTPRNATAPLLSIDDLSGFARRLRAGLETLPSHQKILGLIARAAGYRNYPHLRAQTTTALRADPYASHGFRAFRDAAQIRRTMVENRMLERTRDGAVYTRIEARPGADALALIAALGQV